MKQIAIAALLLFTVSANAQTPDLRRKIEVTGTAETEVTPDIIYFSVSLKEYMDGKTKVDIDQLEGQLQKAVYGAGVTREDLTINNISGYITYQKKKDPNFLASKQYTIKFHDLNKVNQILSGINSKGIESTNIISYDYSKIEDLKRELKLKALLAAKEKAGFLMSGIGEKIGGALEVTEIDDNNLPQQRNVMYKAMSFSGAAVPEPDIDFKKIKLTFQIRAVFEIVK
jgi:uncharacterized protein YggE